MASSLNKLLKRRPTQEELDQIEEEFATDGPRGVAILASVQVEDVLGGALLQRMVELTDDEYGQLFQGTAPLATFSAKIRLGYALGIFGKKTRHDMDILRQIRNVFAHARTPVDFDAPEIAGLCAGFNCLVDRKQQPPHARGRYIEAARMIMFRLVFEIGDERPLKPAWLSHMD
jgi:hypothetical protein